MTPAQVEKRWQEAAARNPGFEVVYTDDGLAAGIARKNCPREPSEGLGRVAKSAKPNTDTDVRKLTTYFVSLGADYNHAAQVAHDLVAGKDPFAKEYATRPTEPSSGKPVTTEPRNERARQTESSLTAALEMDTIAARSSGFQHCRPRNRNLEVLTQELVRESSLEHARLVCRDSVARALQRAPGPHGRRIVHT